jgi:hypothetical protein
MKYHNSYEKRAYKELRKVFKKWNNKVFGIEFKENSINEQLMATINANDMYTTYYNIYFNIGVIHGTRVGASINVELNKDFTVPKFMTEFEKNLPLFLSKYGITRIQQVHQTYLEDVAKLFNDRLMAGKTMVETTNEVFAVMKSPRFYKWQAERIARTETTAAANFAAVESGKVSGFVMEKRWISALDNRTRDPHASTNGQRRPEKEAFNVGGERLMYPGDPNGSAANVINCRCTIAVIPKRGKGGRLIRTN